MEYPQNKEYTFIFGQITCESLVASLITPCLNYGNGLLIGATDTVIGKYQRIQNIAAKLILNRSKTDSATKA